MKKRSRSSPPMKRMKEVANGAEAGERLRGAAPTVSST